MQGMGIDREDISDVPTTGSEKTSKNQAIAEKAKANDVAPQNQKRAATTTTDHWQAKDKKKEKSAKAHLLCICPTSSPKRQKCPLGPKHSRIRIEDLGVEKSTPELLRTDKQFVKLIHKQGKEMEGLKKRHNKERTTMQRSHCAVVDKMTAAHNKERTTEEKSSEKQLKKKGSNSNDLKIDPGWKVQQMVSNHQTKVKELVMDQIKEWSDLMDHQRNEEHDMHKSHLEQQSEVLKQLMGLMQAQRLKELHKCQDREVKDLKGKQAKHCVDVAKGVMQDNSIKNKAERDRQIRDLQENSVKKFLEERKRQAMIHARQHEQLGNLHREQKKGLRDSVQKELVITEMQQKITS